MHAPDDDYLTVKEAATLLRVAPGTVRRWIRAGEVPAYYLGSHRVALRRNDVVNLITPIPPEIDLDDNTRDLSESDIDALLERIRAEGRANRVQFKGRRLSEDEVQRGLEAMKHARQLSDEILARRGGKLFPPSWITINEMRDERTRQLTGE
ncbi:MAG: helix-turn-helix domain-containing protein [Thermomicrobiales bacterium]